MKKLFFLFAFLGLFAFASNAQTKACCASKKSASVEKTSSAATTDIESALAADASIVKKVSNTGEVTYVREEVDASTGKVSHQDVEFCTKSGKFVNVSPSEKAACCTKEGSAKKVSNKKANAKKSCCAGGEKKSSE